MLPCLVMMMMIGVLGPCLVNFIANHEMICKFHPLGFWQGYGPAM